MEKDRRESREFLKEARAQGVNIVGIVSTTTVLVAMTELITYSLCMSVGQLCVCTVELIIYVLFHMLCTPTLAPTQLVYPNL